MGERKMMINFYIQKRPRDQDIIEALAEAGLDVSNVIIDCYEREDNMSGLEVSFVDDFDDKTNSFKRAYVVQIKNGVWIDDGVEHDNSKIEGFFAKSLAHKSGLPVLVFTREDFDNVYDVLDKYEPDGTKTYVELDEETDVIIKEAKSLPPHCPGAPLALP